MEKSETDSGEGPGARDLVAEQRALRLAKLERLRDGGSEPSPPGFRREHPAAEVAAEAGEPAPGTITGTTVRISGRLMLIRDHGGVIFATLRDQSGTIQVAFERDRLDRHQTGRERSGKRIHGAASKVRPR
jgi:lysyl-tRNA synthetase class 2